MPDFRCRNQAEHLGGKIRRQQRLRLSTERLRHLTNFEPSDAQFADLQRSNLQTCQRLKASPTFTTIILLVRRIYQAQPGIDPFSPDPILVTKPCLHTTRVNPECLFEKLPGYRPGIFGIPAGSSSRT